MKKITRLIAPFIILCLLTPGAFGLDRIKTKITLTPDTWMLFENSFAIETPTTGQDFKLRVETRYNDEPVESVKIVKLNGFFLKESPEIINEGDAKVYIYKMKAPDNEGTYMIEFESRTQSEEIINYDTSIEVVEDDPKQTWLRVGIWAGIAIVTVGTALLVSNAGK